MTILKKDLDWIREKIESSERPLFFHDDDPDGLVSFLLLYKMVKKGKGVIIKASPEIKKEYLRKVEEYGPDLIVILDKPKVCPEFVEGVRDITTIWIDHHEPQNPEGIHYFNPRIEKDSDNRPVSYFAYKINNDKKDLWLAMTGCVSDWFLPKDLKGEFIEAYPDLLSEEQDIAPKALFDSGLSVLCKAFSFVLKGRGSDVSRSIKILTRVESPYEILKKESSRGRLIYNHYDHMNDEYLEILNSVDTSDEKLILFFYEAKKVSFTADLSNELLHRFPNKVIIIGREKDGQMKMSLRSANHNLPKLLKHALKGVDGYGGGHKNACGSAVKVEDFDKFINQLKSKL